MPDFDDLAGYRSEVHVVGLSPHKIHIRIQLLPSSAPFIY